MTILFKSAVHLVHPEQKSVSTLRSLFFMTFMTATYSWAASIQCDVRIDTLRREDQKEEDYYCYKMTVKPLLNKLNTKHECDRDLVKIFFFDNTYKSLGCINVKNFIISGLFII